MDISRPTYLILSNKFRPLKTLQNSHVFEWTIVADQFSLNPDPLPASCFCLKNNFLYQKLPVNVGVAIQNVKFSSLLSSFVGHFA
jgi:hypothetical protein